MLRVHVHLSKRASGCHTKVVDASTSPLPLSPRRSYHPHYPSISMTNTKPHQRRARLTGVTKNIARRDKAEADTVTPRKDCAERKGNNVPLAVRRNQCLREPHCVLTKHAYAQARERQALQTVVDNGEQGVAAQRDLLDHREHILHSRVSVPQKLAPAFTPVSIKGATLDTIVFSNVKRDANAYSQPGHKDIRTGESYHRPLDTEKEEELAPPIFRDQWGTVFPNLSCFLLANWANTGDYRKTEAEVDRLVHEVILAPGFDPKELLLFDSAAFIRKRN